MNSTLKRYKLRQLIEVTRGQSLSGEYYAEQGDIIRLTLANFDYQNGGFKEDLQKADIYYTGPVKTHCLLNKGDIITPLTEQTPGLLGSTARIPESGKYVQSGDVALIKCNEELIDPSFCYYLLPSSQVKKQLAVGSQQTKIRHTSPDAIKDCIVDIPDIEQQRKIGKLLDAITAKIDEDRKQNAILEKIAKQIYDYWFVQFDFPDENGRPYKSSGGKMVWNEKLKREIPEGWELYCLEKLGDFKNGINYSKDEVGDRQYKIVNVRNISSSSIFIDNSDLDELTLKCSNGDNYLVKDSDILIARSGTPGATRLIRDIKDNVIYCGFIICYTLNDLDDKPFLFYSIKQLEGVTQAQSNGSILRNISQDVLKQLLVSMPPTKIKLMFNEKVKTIFASIQNGLREIESLSEQRDKLLPLLMTGQVKLK